jgi:hypothetical protein
VPVFGQYVALLEAQLTVEHKWMIHSLVSFLLIIVRREGRNSFTLARLMAYGASQR